MGDEKYERGVQRKGLETVQREREGRKSGRESAKELLNKVASWMKYISQ